MRWLWMIVAVGLLTSCIGRAASTTPLEAADAWGAVTVAGDYAKARTLAYDPDGVIFSVWQADTETARRARHLESYDIARQETRGTTTAIHIEFRGSDPQWPIHCTLIFVDQAGKVDPQYPYTPSACPRDDATP